MVVVDHLLAFRYHRYHPPQLRHPHLQLTCLREKGPVESRIESLTLKISGIDDLRMAAASRLVKAGVSSIVLKAPSYGGDRTHACEIGHESAGQHVLERGSSWMQGAGAACGVGARM